MLDFESRQFYVAVETDLLYPGAHAERRSSGQRPPDAPPSRVGRASGRFGLHDPPLHPDQPAAKPTIAHIKEPAMRPLKSLLLTALLTAAPALAAASTKPGPGPSNCSKPLMCCAQLQGAGLFCPPPGPYLP